MMPEPTVTWPFENCDSCDTLATQTRPVEKLAMISAVTNRISLLVSARPTLAAVYSSEPSGPMK